MMGTQEPAQHNGGGGRILGTMDTKKKGHSESPLELVLKSLPSLGGKVHLSRKRTHFERSSILPRRPMRLQSSLLLVLMMILAVDTLPACTALRWPRRPGAGAKNKVNVKTKKNQPNQEDDTNSNIVEESVLSSQQLEPLLQVPCAIQLAKNPSHRSENKRHRRITPIAAFCDTGAQRTCMSWEAAQRLGLAHLLDPRYAGQAMGVGLCRVLGRIPAQTVILHFSSDDRQDITIMAPAITILESTGSEEGVELLFGLDFLRDAQAVIDVQDEFVRLTGKIKQEHHGNHPQDDKAVVEVSFIRPRQGLDLEDAFNHKKIEKERSMKKMPIPRRMEASAEDNTSRRSSEGKARNNQYESDSEFEEEDDFESGEEDDGIRMDFSGI